MTIHRFAILPALLLALGIGAVAEQDLSDRFYQAIRNNDLSSLRELLKSGDINVKDKRGAIPLMYVAAFGNAEEMTLLLDAGADVKARNEFNATALIWAAGDPVKSRMLIAHGADVNAQSKQGATPLMAAARRDGGADLVRLLLVKGADPNARDGQGGTALHLAALTGDVATMRLLIDRGADVNAVKNPRGTTALLNAVLSNNVEAIGLLVASGANTNVTPVVQIRRGNVTGAIGKETPLMWAAPYGSPEMIRTLLKANTDVNAVDARGMTALMLAVGSETQDVGIVKLLLKAGANVNIRSSVGERALDWAKKFGNRAVIAALQEAGAKEGLPYSAPPGPSRITPPAATKAVEKSVALLQRSSTEYFKQCGCVGCHHQPMTAMAVRAARSAGIPVDEAAAREQLNVIKLVRDRGQERHLQGIDEVPPDAIMGYWGLLAGEPITDSLVADAASLQRSDGSWQRTVAAPRAPMVESGISLTARIVQLLQMYGIPGREAEFRGRIARARVWLLGAKPRTTDEYAYVLLGLSSVGAEKQKIRHIGDSLIAQQRTDGGWAGNPNLSSDAFATGETLYALRESGFVTVSDSVYQRGVRYLLSTQYPDGSWHVRSRAVKAQPYFESGFPFGDDQWISAAATAWASMALAAQVEQNRKMAER
jgi:ankyrin repeat protein